MLCSIIKMLKNIWPDTDKQALVRILIIHLLLSIVWFCAGGYILTKDSITQMAVATAYKNMPVLGDVFSKVGYGYDSWALGPNGPFYSYFIFLLQRLPGGFAPYHFVFARLMYTIVPLGFYYAARCWRTPRQAFWVVLLCFIEPLHQADCINLMANTVTVPGAVLAFVIVLYGWKYNKTSYFLWLIPVLGIAMPVRNLLLCIVPFLLLFAILKGAFSQRLTRAGIVVAACIIGMLPMRLFYAENPHYKTSVVDKIYWLNAMRMMQCKMFSSNHTPESIDLYYSYVPRFRTIEDLYVAHPGTSLPNYHAFIHERVKGYGDLQSEAFKRFVTVGKSMIREHPSGIAKTSVYALLTALGYPPRYNSLPKGYNFELPTMGKCMHYEPQGMDLLWVQSSPYPFDEYAKGEPPRLIAQEYYDSLVNSMPERQYWATLVLKTLADISPFKRSTLLILMIVSVACLLKWREWEPVLFMLSCFTPFFLVVLFLSLLTTSKVLLIIPFVVWGTGMVVSGLREHLFLEVP